MFASQINLFRIKSAVSIRGRSSKATDPRSKRWSSTPAKELLLPPLLLSMLHVFPSPVLLSQLSECLNLTSFDLPPTLQPICTVLAMFAPQINLFRFQSTLSICGQLFEATDPRGDWTESST
ncbi:hypothetical protein J3R30DRAFT_3709859 [Lentinula aciculospora]|uniref:Uncharacterized protein n=1 Tax=Lentinula aciculospora TaxID=153920 RepID=A0A9W9A148_9AGAR|nr:hypothetical protein J3R30DRAFT_3709859 [Lentinula aciculospora]